MFGFRKKNYTPLSGGLHLGHQRTIISKTIQHFVFDILLNFQLDFERLPQFMFALHEQIGSRDENLHLSGKVFSAWLKVFRINPEFRILRLTFHRRSASKC